MRIVKKISGLTFSLIILLTFLSGCGYNFPNQKPSQKAPAPASESTPVAQNTPEQNVTVIKKRVKVAVLLPISGKNKELGQSVLNSVILSLFENDKDNNLELVIFDSKDKAEDASKAMQEIINQNIKVVIGPIFTSEVNAITNLAQNNDINVLSLSNNQDLANKKNIFLMGFLPEQQIERITNYAINQGKDGFAIVTANNQYGLKFAGILKEMVKRKDGNFISSNFYFNSNKDLEKASIKAVGSYIVSSRVAHKNKKDLKDTDKIYANTILIPESGVALSKIASAINKANTNQRDIQILGSSSWDDMETLNDPNLIGAWFVAPNPDKYKDFERRYYQIYGKFPIRISSIGYDVIDALSRVIKQSGKREISINDLINYQSPSNGFDGIDGLFRFLPNGITQRNLAILRVGNGKFEIIDSPTTMFFKY